MGFSDVDKLAINTIRTLAVDATFKANSGHPGSPMGMAPAAHELFNKFMTFNPDNPKWANRDRFVLSNGHGCMLQHALLHLCGYDLSMDDIKNFRTPGHPESFETPGVEVTTGPLGQGFANAVGLAIAQAHIAGVFNKPGHNLISNRAFCFFGDGCAMEGIASEAASLAGHLWSRKNECAKNGKAKENDWNNQLARYAEEYPAEYAEFVRRTEGKLPDDLEATLPEYCASDAAVASRKLSETVLEKINSIIPELLSGSADLTGSNNTRWKGAIDFQPPEYGIGEWDGRYIRYGGREHAMASIMNGLAAYGLIVPLSGGFLNFVSYNAPSIRLAALSKLRVIHIATHDSIALGQDGPTHQPIEVLSHFRARPNCMHSSLTRQNLPHLKNSSVQKALMGGCGYMVLDSANAAVTLVSTGSEVSVCLQAAAILEKQDISARVVSIPCFEVFDQQEESYRLQVLPDDIPILSAEAASTLGWERYSHQQFGINRFGASAPPDELFKMFNLTPEGVAKRAALTVSFYAGTLSVGKQTVLSPIRRAFAQIL
ncbi:transketolase [Penicillium daleae]|uniref:transketolase n=1 Tax=Penicillium daleae TaxID=63821 RepID=A0AAD6G4I5_9EURO|nr:transketolase [Penicillium daleae]KAJ5455691.1 transketolase [Penicillium daleae]